MTLGRSGPKLVTQRIGMIEQWTLFFVATSATMFVIIYWVLQTVRHNSRMSKVPIRIHVNGIRGKSTIVRYIAASLRAGGIETIAKTTGSATMLIDKMAMRHQSTATVLRQLLSKLKSCQENFAPPRRQSCSNAWLSTPTTSGFLSIE